MSKRYKTTKTGIPEVKNTKFCKMQKENIFYTHNFFQIGTCAKSLHNVTPQNIIFIRATPCQSGFAPNSPVHKFRVVFLQNRALAPWGGQFVTFWPFLLLPHFSSEMPLILVRNRCGPRTDL